VVRVELPGVDITKDVDVEVVDRRLVISGSRRDERAEDEAGRRLRELRYARRTFRLGGNVTADAVRASYDAGVLTVRVAGAYAGATGQRIEISTETPAVDADEATVEGEATEA
jgi:HSP20 family protein